MLILTLGGIFIGTFSLLVVGYIVVNRRQLSESSVARDRLLGATAVAVPAAPSILRTRGGGAFPALDALLDRMSFNRKLEQKLRYAGVRMRPSYFVVAAAAGAIVLWFALGGGLMAAVIALLAGALGPLEYLKWRHAARRAAFNALLPEALDMLVSAVRTGYSLPMALRFVADEVPAPVGSEFATVHDEQRLGVDLRSALVSMQERVDSTDLKMFVTAVLIQRETGGNLSEVLGNIAEVMRERADVQRRIEALTSEAKMSARVLSLLPVIVFGGILMLDPTFAHPMLASPLGRVALVLCGMSIAAGYVIMMRLASVDV
jgi:tight adherence protein B